MEDLDPTTLLCWTAPTYRIPVSGTEGCFNDLRNDRPATLYLRVAGSGVSSARLLMKKPVSLSCRDEQEFAVCSLWQSL